MFASGEAVLGGRGSRRAGSLGLEGRGGRALPVGSFWGNWSFGLAQCVEDRACGEIHAFAVPMGIAGVVKRCRVLIFDERRSKVDNGLQRIAKLVQERVVCLGFQGRALERSRPAGD